MLDTALEAKVLANKDESKCFEPLIAVIRPVRDRYHLKNHPFIGVSNCGVEKSLAHVILTHLKRLSELSVS